MKIKFEFKDEAERADVLGALGQAKPGQKSVDLDATEKFFITKQTIMLRAQYLRGAARTGKAGNGILVAQGIFETLEPKVN